MKTDLNLKTDGMECTVCSKKLPQIAVQQSGNCIADVITLSVVLGSMGWHVDGELVYCPSHKPTPPDDMMEQMAEARGQMLAAKARKRD